MLQKLYFQQIWILIAVLFILNSGCQDPLTVGNDLLDDQKINIGVIDSFDISTTTIPGERVVTHRPNVDSRLYYLGQMNDHLFGKTSAELFLKFQMGTVKPNYHTEVRLKFDSLVLTLQYDSTAIYGNTTGNQQIEVFQSENSYSERDTFYSDVNFTVSSRSIASQSKGINIKDSVSITDHITKNPIKQAPHLRIRLNDGFGMGLITNVEAGKNDTAFVDFMKGFKITSTPTDNNSFLYGFNLSNSGLNAQGSLNKLTMYYSVASGDTTLRKTYEYFINYATINRFVHNTSGSQLANVLRDTSLANGLTYLQPMGGSKTVIRIKDLNKLSDKQINKAELTVYIAEPTGKEFYNSPPSQITAAYKLSNGRLALIPDIDQLVNSNTNFAPVFGGSLDNRTTVHKYTMNITNHIKSVLKDKNHSPDLYLGILTESEVAQRAILYGGKHGLYPIKLRVTHTKN
jgi:hypothetical protein